MTKLHNSIRRSKRTPSKLPQGSRPRPVGCGGAYGCCMDARRIAAYSATPLELGRPNVGLKLLSSEPAGCGQLPFLATPLVARAGGPVQRGVSIGRAGRVDRAGRGDCAPFQRMQGSFA